MEADTISKNKTNLGKWISWKFVPLLILWLLPLNFYAGLPVVTFKGNMPDSVYIVRYDGDYNGRIHRSIWHTKLPATVTLQHNHITGTFKIYAENYAVKEITVKKNKKYDMEFEKIVRTDNENFLFWKELLLICTSVEHFNQNKKYNSLSNEKIFEYAYVLFQKSWTFSNILDEDKKNAYLTDVAKSTASMGTDYYHKDAYLISFIKKIHDYVGLTNDECALIWLISGETSANHENSYLRDRSIRYFRNWYEQSGISKDEYFYFLLTKGDEILNKQITSTGISYYSGTSLSNIEKGNNIKSAIQYFEEAKAVLPDNNLAEKYLAYTKKLKQENDNVKRQEEKAWKAAEAQQLAANLQGLGTALQNFGATINNYNNRGSNSGSSTSDGSSSNKSKSTNTSTNADCGQAWITDSNTYSSYETLVIKGNPDSDNIRAKMRQLRQKWEGRGCKINKSPYE